MVYRCSEAIRSAITQYNAQATLINHPTITWKEIVEYSFLDELDLLHNSHLNISECDWAKLTHLEATHKYLKLCCTEEEIIHLNIKVC
ncbi:hypothetical protein F5J12DRAFT_724964 [Pisolithus orientalis]|uniref:uncharacterized protein n=1 Tax=Pisolithus orientalis TaxID=936130 RepID=UPI002224D9B0|nr:uncharacterized protein F5J12DRAFT_724964 [Pisolithus orientalis]KAI5998404.1 hypothetical protein F5J12DRAFT_724964 [Pisolithus orientalis]